MRVLASILRDATVTVTIVPLTGKAAGRIADEAERQGARQLIDHPIEDSVSINGVPLADFDGTYVTRIIVVDSGIDAADATAAWVDGD